MDKDILLDLNNVKAYYNLRTFEKIRSVKAVDGISLEVRENEILGIAGESGSGKSTLGKVVYGYIEYPLTFVEGEMKYFYKENEIKISPPNIDFDSLINLRWEVVSYIPQSSMNVLNPIRKIGKIFEDVIISHKKDVEEYRSKIIDNLKYVGLSSEVLNLYPYQLSGGMRQRVVIALAMLFSPKIIIADEPTSALDVVTQYSLLKLFKKINRENKSSFIFITHDMSIIANLTHRVAIMYAGKILEIGNTKDIFEKPYHPYTKFLITSIPQIGDKSERPSIPGLPPNLIDPPLGCRFYSRCPDAKDRCNEEEPPLVEVEKGHKVACFRLV